MHLYPFRHCGLFYGRSFLWQPSVAGDELIYRLAVWASLRSELFALAYFIFGYLFIFHYYWKKPFEYFQEVTDATKNLYDQNAGLITLSPPLSELEVQLNQIKLNVEASERAAKRQSREERSGHLSGPRSEDADHIGNRLSDSAPRRTEPFPRHAGALYKHLAGEGRKAGRSDQRIFEITRFNLSHITLETQQVDLSLMLHQLVYEFQPMLKEKICSAGWTRRTPFPLRCDPDKLQRVFDNLLRNAVNYSFTESCIRIRASEEDGQAVLVFENDGNTISEEKLSRLFEQFFRLDTSRSSKSGGAGLGLAIAKEITELHGGTITAWSRDNIIRFTVSLPLS